MADDLVLVIALIIGAVLEMPAQEAAHLILIQVHIADITIPVLIVDVVVAIFAVGTSFCHGKASFANRNPENRDVFGVFEQSHSGQLISC